ncbi:MAG: Cof-type HAD-IIB family hydrolase [Lachnospiraceae bacterium]
MKKAVFFDIDGTIWDLQFKIPDSTREAIKSLKEKGHDCFLCTGRTRDYVRNEELLSLGFSGIVAGCGTYVEYLEEELFYQCIPNDLLRKTVHLLTQFQVPTILEGRRNHFLNMEEFAEDPYLKVMEKELGDHILPIQGNEDKWEASKLTIEIAGIPKAEVFPQLEPNYTIICHGDYYAELVPKGMNKAAGIKRTCELLDIPWENTYAFGDSANDLEMLQYVNYGIAMGNGTKEAKEAADYVTTDIHRDGIKNGLLHYGLI